MSSDQWFPDVVPKSEAIFDLDNTKQKYAAICLWMNLPDHRNLHCSDRSSIRFFWTMYEWKRYQKRQIGETVSEKTDGTALSESETGPSTSSS
jgi:hypothetical protein